MFNKNNIITYLNNNKNNVQRHSFHIVSSSIWPLRISSFLFLIILIFVVFRKGDFLIFKYAFFLLRIIFGCRIYGWFSDILYERDILGNHTKSVQYGLLMGFRLFILSEVMLFFSFFWAFWHSARNPSIFIGGVWPPVGIVPLNSFGLPFVNTVLLLVSGVCVTWRHSLIELSKKTFYDNSDIDEEEFKFLPSYIRVRLLRAIVLGVIFTLCQLYEYRNATFGINDSIYGSTFFILTGLHGLHVVVGTVILIVQFIRFINTYVFSNQYNGLTRAIWYWHFVDIIWLFVFCWVYIWAAL